MAIKVIANATISSVLCMLFLTSALGAVQEKVTVTSDYDAVKEAVTIHLVNNSHKDVSAFSMSMSINYVDGTADPSEMSEDFLEVVIGVADDAQYLREHGNGSFAAGATLDKVIPVQKNVKNVVADVDVVVYTDATSEVRNRRSYNRLVANRKGRVLAIQKADEAIKQASNSPNPSGVVAAELNRLADISKTKNVPPDDPEAHMELHFRNLAQEVEQSGDLQDLLKRHEARIASLAQSQPHEVNP